MSPIPMTAYNSTTEKVVPIDAIVLQGVTAKDLDVFGNMVQSLLGCHDFTEWPIEWEGACRDLAIKLQDIARAILRPPVVAPTAFGAMVDASCVHHGEPRQNFIFDGQYWRPEATMQTHLWSELINPFVIFEGVKR